MPLPKYLRKRGDTWCVRYPVPLADQAAFGRKEVWKTLGTTSRREAEAKSHAVIAGIKDQIEAKRRERQAASEEGRFLASDRFDDALGRHFAATRALDSGGQPFARHSDGVDGMANAALEIRIGFTRPRPASRVEAAEAIENDLAELEALRSRAGLVRSIDADGEPDFGSIPAEYVPALMARLQELFEADKRTMEAQLAVIRGTDRVCDPEALDAETSDRKSLTGLAEVWKAHRKPTASSQADMRTTIARFGRVNGPLHYASVIDEHARRLKADLLGDAGLKNATRQKLWGMLRALLNVAVDDGLLDANPFSRVKLSSTLAISGG